MSFFKLFFILLVVIIGIVTLGVWYRFSRLPKPKHKKPQQMLQPQKWSKEEVTVGWVGHSTVLMQMFDVKILTDPVLGKRVGQHLGGNWQIGPKRHTDPAVSFSDLKSVQLILLSHAHFDHFDIPSLTRLAHEECYVITPKNTAHLIKKLPFKKVFELSWDEQIEIEELGVKVLGVPVKHWGNRYPWNRSYGYNGYLIEKKGVRIFFPGDTAFTHKFRQLEKLGPIDLAFMPIGAYSPSEFQWAHCTPEEAWAMFCDTGAKWLVPIHWDTFVLSYEPLNEPLERLLRIAGEEANRIVCREHGESFTIPLEDQLKKRKQVQSMIG